MTTDQPVGQTKWGHVLNYKPDPRDDRDHKIFHAVIPSQLPAEYDLRKVLGQPVVFDQGQIGSCTSNSSSLAYIFYLALQYLKVWTPSRLFVYANTRILEGVDVSQDSGATNRDTIKAIAKNGMCDESIWPYIPNDYFVKPSNAAYQKAYHGKFAYKSVPQDIHQIKQTLVNGSAIIVGLTIYESFESDAVARTGNVPMPNLLTEQCLGGHSVCIIGFSDSKQCFLLQNSWSDRWGWKGCFWLPYQYMLDRNLATDFWSLIV